LRIGIDILGVQSPASRGRGIGRYARSFLTALVEQDARNEYVLYAHRGLSTSCFPSGNHARVRQLGIADDSGQAIDQLARENPDALDLLLILSPFEIGSGYDPPAKPLNGLAMAAVVYDVVPFLFPERYLTWPPAAARLYRGLERLRGYDALLAISDATRKDTEDMLGIRDGRVTNISAASEPGFFFPSEPTAQSQEVLAQYGIEKPYVMCVAGLDWRKNLVGLFDGFALLPQDVRTAHQLVLAYRFSEEEVVKVRAMAHERAIGSSLVLTGGVCDEALRELYRRCAVFAFPAFYEGFGLPLLEAMHCGAPVVGGNNSSQIEVVGDAGSLVNAHDPGDIAAKIARVLTDRGFANRLRARALEHANTFSWDATGDRARQALERAVSLQARHISRRIDRAPVAAKPRVAIFSPWPPRASGISDYSLSLARELRRFYTVDLYHDDGYEPDLCAEQADFNVYHHRIFGARAAAIGYRGVLHQTGNSLYHNFIYDAIARVPGVVTLHDFCLAGFHKARGRQRPDGVQHFESLLRALHPREAADVVERVQDWDREDRLAQEFARRGLWMNREIFERARRVIVHSPWCRELVESLYPQHLAKTVVVPAGASPSLPNAERRRRVRHQHALPAGALVFGSFGIVHANKRNVETVQAFAQVAVQRRDALLIFVGQDLTGGEPRELAHAFDIAHQVRMLGRVSLESFFDLIAAVDVGVCLRSPPTSGETSAALLHLMQHGVPTIVSDVATFGDYPDTTVRKVPADFSIGELARAMHELAANRAELGASALQHVVAHNTWPEVAQRYADEIERVYQEAGPIVGRAPRSASLCLS
jgi:glycosyltransferase involved in cell wall biosynthesis